MNMFYYQNMPVTRVDLDCSGSGLSAMHGTGSTYTTRDAPAYSTLPDPLRCGYTSKRCENPRTVKKSGGLHRFCAYHRERANKNQWRVDHRRRLLRKQGSAVKSETSDCDSPRSATSELLEEIDMLDATAISSVDSKTSIKTEPSDSYVLDLNDLSGSPNSLSEQDAEILNAMLFSDEDEHNAAVNRVHAAANAGHLRPHHDLHVSHDHTMMLGDPRRASCICSQCLAWSTVYFYHDAMQQAREARQDTYSRV